jgi:hypothetical protein
MPSKLMVAITPPHTSVLDLTTEDHSPFAVTQNNYLLNVHYNTLK